MSWDYNFYLFNIALYHLRFQLPLHVCNVNIGQINDALLRTLDAEREGTPIAVEDGAAAGAAPLLDLDGGSDDLLNGKVRWWIPQLCH